MNDLKQQMGSVRGIHHERVLILLNRGDRGVRSLFQVLRRIRVSPFHQQLEVQHLGVDQTRVRRVREDKVPYASRVGSTVRFRGGEKAAPVVAQCSAIVQRRPFTRIVGRTDKLVVGSMAIQVLGQTKQAVHVAF